MSIFNHLVRIRGLEIMLCIASWFFMAMSCETPGDDKTEPPTWGVTTLAGGSRGFANGTGRDAKFNEPAGLALAEHERTLYIADRGNHCIRSLDIASRNVSTLAGNCDPARTGSINGTGTAARFTNPEHLAFYSGTLYVADSNSVRQINVQTAAVRVLGLPANSFDETTVSGLAIKPDGSRLYFLDSQKGRIREIDLAARPKTLRTLVGPDTTGGGIGPRNGGPAGSPAPVSGVCFRVFRTTSSSCEALFNQPKGMAISPDGKAMFIADDPMNTHVIRAVVIPTGLVLSTAVTLRNGLSARAGLVNVQGKTYIADGAANWIRLLEGTGIQTFAGNGEAASRDGSLPDSSFHQPEAITANHTGDRIYVADVGSHSIRLIALK